MTTPMNARWPCVRKDYDVQEIGKMALTGAAALGLVAGGVALAPAAPAQAGVHIYEDINYNNNGRNTWKGYLYIGTGTWDDFYSMKDKASSLKIFGDFNVRLNSAVNRKGLYSNWTWVKHDSSLANNIWTNGAKLNDKARSSF